MCVLAAASNIGNERPAVRQGSFDGHPWPWLLINILRRQTAILPSFAIIGPRSNTVHFAIWMAAATSIHVVGCGVRGRSG